jgi:hypothetical protein
MSLGFITGNMTVAATTIMTVVGMVAGARKGGLRPQGKKAIA